jgi:hypothetical protein
MLEQVSENRAKDMKNEINQLFDKVDNSPIIELIEKSIGRRNF